MQSTYDSVRAPYARPWLRTASPPVSSVNVASSAASASRSCGAEAAATASRAASSRSSAARPRSRVGGSAWRSSAARSSRSVCGPPATTSDSSRVVASSCTPQDSRCTARSRTSGPQRIRSGGPSPAISPHASGPKKPIVSFLAQ